MAEAQMEKREFTGPETQHLSELADTANRALAPYYNFLEFLRKQHDAPEAEGWGLGNKGFVRELPTPPTPPTPSGEPPAPPPAE